VATEILGFQFKGRSLPAMASTYLPKPRPGLAFECMRRVLPCLVVVFS